MWKSINVASKKLWTGSEDCQEAYKLSFFLNGLSDEIKHGVKMLYPQNVNIVYALAKHQEELVVVQMRSLKKPHPLLITNLDQILLNGLLNPKIPHKIPTL